MKMKHRRAPLTAAAAHQDDSTAKLEAGAEPTVHRRTTVTVERETLSILMRRPVAETIEESKGEDSMPEPSAGKQPAASPKLLDQPSGGKT